MAKVGIILQTGNFYRNVRILGAFIFWGTQLWLLSAEGQMARKSTMIGLVEFFLNFISFKLHCCYGVTARRRFQQRLLLFGFSGTHARPECHPFCGVQAGSTHGPVSG